MAEEPTQTNNGSSPLPTGAQRKVSIVVVGKSGAGKSTLARNIVGSEQQLQLSANRITTSCNTQETVIHGIVVEVTDIVGLVDQRQRNKIELEHLRQHTGGKADLVIYCLPVNPASKFNDSNPVIMKSLQDVFGEEIWKQCLLVLTFSNIVMDRLKKNSNDQNEATAQYKKFLKEHTAKFRDELRSLNVKNVNTRLAFGFQSEVMADNESTIVAIPAGDEPNNLILPDLEEHAKFTIPGEEEEFVISGWKEVLFAEILRKCGTNQESTVLQHRSRDVVNTRRSGGAAVRVPGVSFGASLRAVESVGGRIGEGTARGFQRFCKCYGSD